MYKIYKTLSFVFFAALIFINHATAQIDSQRVAPAIPQVNPVNAGFDVIIKNNGEIVYGLIKEVTPDYVSYKRTDIPDGPVYTIFRNEVYAISYRNQVKEYMNGSNGDELNGDIGMNNQDYPYPRINYKKGDFLKSGTARIGLGFIRSFSKVDNVKNYSSSASFPVISFAYDAHYKDNIDLGLMLGFGSHSFSDAQYSSYDSTINNISLKENIFALYVYGRYRLLKNSSRLQPYVMAGLGITSSHILSENKINFTTDNTQTLLVKSGSRTAGIGITARIGSVYYINNQLQAFLDAGVGLSVINLGLAIKVK
ncbi:MAG: autotransporter outer membrane beta-barrel domain-containing protein [Bacteroidota bacterium]|nr:autotransporter outer membrane beta-barrel domain-containing protein [Bacteroidota bacterium]